MKHYISSIFIVALAAIAIPIVAHAYWGSNENIKTIQRNIEKEKEDVADSCQRLKQRFIDAIDKGEFSQLDTSLNWFSGEYNADWTYFCKTLLTPPTEIVFHHDGIPQAQTGHLLRVNRNHKGRGYAESCYGNNIAYHFMILAEGDVGPDGLPAEDGTIIQNRCLLERSLHTKNQEVSNDSIAIVLAGNFEEDTLTRGQAKSLRHLTNLLKDEFDIEELKGHCHASASKCPGKNFHDFLVRNYDIPECSNHADHDHDEGHSHSSPELPPKLVGHNNENVNISGRMDEEALHTARWLKENRTYHNSPTIKELASFDVHFTRYYSPMPGQSNYLRNSDGSWKGGGGGGSYQADLKMNTQGNPLVPASGITYNDGMHGTVVACPPNYPLKTFLYIENWGFATCEDRGGAIQGSKMDLWTGVGEAGMQRVLDRNYLTGTWRVTIVATP